MLIGHEIASARARFGTGGDAGARARIIGSDALAARYAAALAQAGIDGGAGPADAAARGLHASHAGRAHPMTIEPAGSAAVPYLEAMPVVAVLRGITPEEIPAIGDALVDAGFRIIEVPLNSPRPFESVQALAERYGERCLVGAGTVLDPNAVPSVAAAGGRLIVMPHSDARVIARSEAPGPRLPPGVATPTEAFAALAAGADGLKMFPAEQLPPPVLKAWRAVLPEGTLMIPVGGISPDKIAAYWEAGAAGFGTGWSVYRPGSGVREVAAAAAAFAAAARNLPPRQGRVLPR